MLWAGMATFQTSLNTVMMLSVKMTMMMIVKIEKFRDERERESGEAAALMKKIGYGNWRFL